MGVQERKAREFQRREREILDAALRLFDRDDWQSVTIEQIAEAAEIGKGTIYKHFANKDEIYARLDIDFHRRMLEQVQQIDPKLDVVERLRAIIRVYLDAHHVGREYRRVVQYCERDDFRRGLSEPTRRECDRLEAALVERLYGVLQDGVSQGIFRSRPIPTMAYGVIAAIYGSVRLLWGGYNVGADTEGSVEELIRFILAGVMHQESQADARK
ncbi:MAG: TetR family transcriptional regulator [Gemmatimonadales bacterium]|nr:TetR family transcriptional regulator [Gemmatimonadales bacterium]NIN12006.1 TetR family transcriptional regulator [Gemmatimonadales bacterium]NIN50537.1 TetR family transcriptional regulator [Gemmatimonadales bacterium]NIP08001.1 TetR family transcriptional regulator [Gemmatimonadales bacterium]NIR00603.1 TetR family transcriptional regulator [Gemmatimonadales bacterium]